MNNIIEINSASAFARSTEKTWISPREAQILDLAGEGLANKEIASALGIAPDTVRAFLRSAFIKLQARDRHEAAAIWQQQMRKAA